MTRLSSPEALSISSFLRFKVRGVRCDDRGVSLRPTQAQLDDVEGSAVGVFASLGYDMARLEKTVDNPNTMLVAVCIISIATPDLDVVFREPHFAKGWKILSLVSSIEAIGSPHHQRGLNSSHIPG